MQQLARKFEADLTFDFGGVTGELKARRATPLSLMRELMADGHGVRVRCSTANCACSDRSEQESRGKRIFGFDT